MEANASQVRILNREFARLLLDFTEGMNGENDLRHRLGIIFTMIYGRDINPGENFVDLIRIYRENYVYLNRDGRRHLEEIFMIVN